MPEQSIRKSFYFALFLGGAVLSVLILWPFAKVIVVSIALTAVLFPYYHFWMRRVKVSWVAAIITVVSFILVLCVPLYFLGTIVFDQSQQLYQWVVQHGGFDNITKIFSRSIAHFFPGGAINLNEGLTAFTHKITSGIGNAFTATLTTIFSFTLVILSMFYFLKDGTNWKKILIHFSPLSDESGQKILQKLDVAVNGIIKGYLLIGCLQGLLMGIGLYLFGVPNAALWGVLAGIASLIPTIGTALVAIPAVLFLFVTGNSGQAIGLAIWAATLVGTVDNILNPIFVGRKIDIHPLLVLFSVLGGISLMGPIGILVGPLAISFIYALMSVYKSEIERS